MIPARTPAEPHAPTLVALWSTSLVIATLGTWLLFRARPGVNWALVTLSASVTLLACAGWRGIDRRHAPCGSAHSVAPTLVVTLTLASALAVAAALTADAFAHGLIAVGIGGLVAIGLVRQPRAIGSSVWSVATLPVGAGVRLAREFLRRVDETLVLATSSRWRALVRGAALALPIVGLFGLMLSSADPILGWVRDRFGEFLTSWDAVPRALLFGALFVLMGGASGLTARGVSEPSGARDLAERTGIGAVERAIVLGAVTLLFGGFLVLQLSYLFGNLPGTVGSGVTFAEYARRGFAELTIVATLCIVLIAALDHAVTRGPARGPARLMELVLLGELTLLLASAFRRLLLYEAAYGFTTARLYGQVYMVWLALVLAIVAAELRRRLDGHRIVRRAGVAAAVLLIGMLYWNHEAWIVERNVARFTTTRQFDARYAVWSLSLNAVPALVAALDALPPDAASSLRHELSTRYDRAPETDFRWYEWNLRRARARQALRGLRHVPLPSDMYHQLVE
jgi:uncharacterized protein DUF4153